MLYIYPTSRIFQYDLINCYNMDRAGLHNTTSREHFEPKRYNEQLKERITARIMILKCRFWDNRIIFPPKRFVLLRKQ